MNTLLWSAMVIMAGLLSMLSWVTWHHSLRLRQLEWRVRDFAPDASEVSDSERRPLERVRAPRYEYSSPSLDGGSGVSPRADKSPALHADLKNFARDLRQVGACVEAMEDGLSRHLDHRLERTVIPHLDSLLAQLLHFEQMDSTSPEYHGAFRGLLSLCSGLVAATDLEEITPEPGAPLDLLQHRVIAEPDEPVDTGRAVVRCVVRHGWRHRPSGTVLRPSEVTVGPESVPETNERQDTSDGKEEKASPGRC